MPASKEIQNAITQESFMPTHRIVAIELPQFFSFLHLNLTEVPFIFICPTILDHFVHQDSSFQSLLTLQSQIHHFFILSLSFNLHLFFSLLRFLQFTTLLMFPPHQK